MKWGNWLIGACCTLFVAVIVTPTGVYQGVWKLVRGDDAAAWVQAFGSIGTIIGAFGVAWFARSQEEKRNARLARKGAFALATAFHGHVERGVISIAELPTGSDIAIIEPSFSRKAMEAFPIHSTNDPAVMVAFLEILALEKARFDSVTRVRTLRHENGLERLQDETPHLVAIRTIGIQVAQHMDTLAKGAQA